CRSPKATPVLFGSTTSCTFPGRQNPVALTHTSNAGGNRRNLTPTSTVRSFPSSGTDATAPDLSLTSTAVNTIDGGLISSWSIHLTAADSPTSSGPLKLPL